MSTHVTNSNSGLCPSFAASVDESDRNTKAMSLRRTLSADMSSKTWSSVQNEFSPINKIVPHVVNSVPVDGPLLEKADQLNRPTQIDIWTSILSQKNDSHSAVSPPPPYVHPLVKRSSSLSKKSLEICTESLGSETGSDVFQSFPTSDLSNNDVVKIDTVDVADAAVEDVHVAKYNCAYHNKKSSSRPRTSFPPPLPSLASRDGASVQMHSRRENGRLVLAAVSVPTQNNFHAQRQDGRLLLTFVNDNKSDMSSEATEKNGVMDQAEDVHKEVFNDKDGEFEEEVLEEVNTKKNIAVEIPKVAGNGVINVHKPTFVVNKVIRLTSCRQTSFWTNKFNEVVKVELQAADEEATDQLDPKPIARSRLTSLISCSTPPSMTSSALTAASSTFNAYEYCWRRKPASATAPVFNTLTSDDTPPSSAAPISKNHNMFILTKAVVGKKDSKHKNEETIMPTDFLVLKGKRGEGEFIVPYFKGYCKDQKRSLLYREPYCIATS